MFTSSQKTWMRMDGVVWGCCLAILFKYKLLHPVVPDMISPRLGVPCRCFPSPCLGCLLSDLAPPNRGLFPFSRIRVTRGCTIPQESLTLPQLLPYSLHPPFIHSWLIYWVLPLAGPSGPSPTLWHQGSTSWLFAEDPWWASSLPASVTSPCKAEMFACSWSCWNSTLSALESLCVVYVLCNNKS